MESKEEKQNISKNLKAIRTSLHISQSMLADKAGIAINSLKAIEQQVGNPQLDTLLLIVKALGCNLNDLTQTDSSSDYAKNMKELERKRITNIIEDNAVSFTEKIIREIIR